VIDGHACHRASLLPARTLRSNAAGHRYPQRAHSSRQQFAGHGPGCHTAAVAAYHEALWVVTGTAAPVIALAIVVSMPDIARDAWTIEDQMDDEDGFSGLFSRPRRHLGPATRYGSQLLGLFALTMLNLLLQVVLLSISIGSIAEGRNFSPPTTGLFLAGGSLLLLAVPVFSASVLRVNWTKARSQREPQPPAEPAGETPVALPADQRPAARTRRERPGNSWPRPRPNPPKWMARDRR
jgi:hypothetical protein